jgi:hypothetical protein
MPVNTTQESQQIEVLGIGKFVQPKKQQARNRSQDRMKLKGKPQPSLIVLDEYSALKPKGPTVSYHKRDPKLTSINTTTRDTPPRKRTQKRSASANRPKALPTSQHYTALSTSQAQIRPVRKPQAKVKPSIAAT